MYFEHWDYLVSYNIKKLLRSPYSVLKNLWAHLISKLGIVLSTNEAKSLGVFIEMHFSKYCVFYSFAKYQIETSFYPIKYTFWQRSTLAETKQAMYIK